VPRPCPASPWWRPLRDWYRRGPRPVEAFLPALPLDAILAASSDALATQRLLIERRLQAVVERQVPLRQLAAAPAPQAARARFADGTGVVVQSGAPGDVGALCLAMHRGSVCPVGWSTDAAGTRLVLRLGPTRRHISVRVTGLDQPD
jgi:hypothetical protein